MVSNKNILIAQGGGPTNVINQSLVGIIQQENNYKSKILGSINGVNGIINNRFISLNKISDNDLKIIANTPGAALGSTRDKPDKKYCKEILKILENKQISKLLVSRGIDNENFEKFSNPLIKNIMPDPYVIDSMECATKKIVEFIIKKKKLDYWVTMMSMGLLLQQLCVVT